MIYTKDNPKYVENIFGFSGINSFTGVVKDEDGDIAYYLNGEFHRTDGPAIIHADGSKYWRLNGKCHREDGPAIEWNDGDKEWCLNDKSYGYGNDFINESWIRFVKLQLLK